MINVAVIYHQFDDYLWVFYLKRAEGLLRNKFHSFYIGLYIVNIGLKQNKNWADLSVTNVKQGWVTSMWQPFCFVEFSWLLFGPNLDLNLS